MMVSAGDVCFYKVLLRRELKLFSTSAVTAVTFGQLWLVGGTISRSPKLISFNPTLREAVRAES